MSSAEELLLLIIFLIGVILLLSLLTKAALEHIGLAPLIGYIALGLILNNADQQWQILSDEGREIMKFLADIGVISLLFRVGLESNFRELLRQLRQASIVWLGDIAVSGGLGFGMAFGLLNLKFIPSLFVGTALTATSVGIAVSLWREAGAMQSSNGELMIDIAEMDDISAVIFMALLFAVVPALHNNSDADLLLILAQTARNFFLKAVVFGACCFVFSRYAERPVTRFFKQIESPPAPAIMVSAIAIMTAAIAGLLGFSVAIGAFFAGLVFSRDPDSVKFDAAFEGFYEAFVPFFFIGIGLQVDLGMLLPAIALGSAILVAAVGGKLIGVIVPTTLLSDWRSGLLISISMVPRAEITMIVMQRGLQLGDWAVPPRIFAAVVFVSMTTTLVVPLVLRPLLRHWPQTSPAASQRGAADSG